MLITLAKTGIQAHYPAANITAIVVTESGWPSKGASDESDTTIDNANNYNSNYGQDSAAVDAFIQRCNLDPDSLITVSPREMDDCNGHGSRMPVKLRAFVELTMDVASASSRRYFFEVMSFFATTEHEKERLKDFASPQGRSQGARSVQQVRSTSPPSSESDSVKYACVVDDFRNHVAHSPPLDSDQFYRAGIAVVNFISDLVHSKLPLSDGMGILSYYKRMNKKIESLLSSLEVRYQQVPMPTPVPSFNNGGGTLDKLCQLMLEDEPIVYPTTDKSSSKMGFDNLDSDESSTEDEFSLLEDMYGSSETSSLNSTEEQLESDQLSLWPYPIAGQ
ncbi:hypothetical protein KIW84_020572 [Lathyrus oleraceus]|uniref:Glucan endo-1,3-beta-D-glucosidase n=1 Tax=Pisum sativum TaxID=3888 RepID=A0A9D4Y7Q5_PEA|nr:hypothetical protein KIW84_020572 [Pisum sativum]